MAEPAGWSTLPISFSFHTLQAYRMPRHRLTTVPANVTTHARVGTRSGTGFEDAGAGLCVVDIGGRVFQEASRIILARRESPGRTGYTWRLVRYALKSVR